MSAGLNGYTYRCIRSGDCSDTSDEALLDIYTTGIDAVFNPSQISVSPNPTPNVLTIIAPGIISKIELIDMVGHQVLLESGNSSKRNLDVSDLPNGIYILKVNNVYVKKIMKQD